MKLVKYQVRKFRSVQNSGWVTLDQVNALLGENESGKTNMLLPLWKLRPSSNGDISLLSDAPRGEYTEVRETPDEDKPFFVTAVFELNGMEKDAIVEIASCPEEWLETVSISRRFDGMYVIQFPHANPQRACERDLVRCGIKATIPLLDTRLECQGRQSRGRLSLRYTFLEDLSRRPPRVCWSSWVGWSALARRGPLAAVWFWVFPVLLRCFVLI